jgi:molybdate transport system permease protein
MDWSPLRLSILVAGWATLFSVIVGLLIAYPLARGRFAGRSVAEGIVNLPLVLPPTVLGYALLVTLGHGGPLDRAWQSVTGHPLGLVFTWRGAVVAACIASIPLFVSHARVAIAGVDKEIVDAARCDGAGRLAAFRHIIVPMAWPGLVAGTALAFARSLGDFGATLMVAGDTPGMTQTMPLAIYDAVTTDDVGVVRTFALITCVICLSVSLLASRLSRPD